MGYYVPRGISRKTWIHPVLIPVLERLTGRPVRISCLPRRQTFGKHRYFKALPTLYWALLSRKCRHFLNKRPKTNWTHIFCYCVQDMGRLVFVQASLGQTLWLYWVVSSKAQRTLALDEYAHMNPLATQSVGTNPRDYAGKIRNMTLWQRLYADTHDQLCVERL